MKYKGLKIEIERVGRGFDYSVKFAGGLWLSGPYKTKRAANADAKRVISSWVNA